MEQERKTRWLLDDLIDSFEQHLEAVCGVSDATRRNYSGYSREFLEHKYRKGVVDVEQLRARDLVKFVSDRSLGCKPKTAQLIATSLRSFLRFLQFHGLCDARLVAVVPTVPIWRQAGLPTGLADEQISGLLASFDRTKPIGLRNYAIALCLVELGLRAGEVARLSIDDIDWRKGTLRVVSGKSGRTGSLPLTESVGRAIALYLRKGRPSTDVRRIFVRHISPEGAPISSTAVSSAIRSAFRRVGIDAPHKGSHILRHTAATRMLRGGASLKEIADVLRHRSLETTTIYAKVDLPMLSEVAMPFPEVL